MNSLWSSVLFLDSDAKWQPIQNWFEYYIRLGRDHALQYPADSRVITAIIVPTRSYCATFYCLGLIIGLHIKSTTEHSKGKFEQLLKLLVNTPVVFYSNKFKSYQKGLVKQPEVRSGKLHVTIQSADKGNTTHFFNESNAFVIEPYDSDDSLPKRLNRSLNVPFDFVKNVLASALSDTTYGHLRGFQLVNHACALVANKSLVREEAVETPFAINVDNTPITGTLQDILHIKDLASKSIVSQIDLFPISSSSLNDLSQIEYSAGVIFDGALGYLKHGSQLSHQHQTVIITRDDPNFLDVINDLGRKFTTRVDASHPLSIEAPPPGCEILSFCV